MFKSMSFMTGFSDTAYYSMPAPSNLNGGSMMSFGILCAVRLGATAGNVIQRFWGNWHAGNDTGWCVQKSALSIATAIGQVFDINGGLVANIASNDPPAEPQSALYRPLFIVGLVGTGDGDYLAMYINGTRVELNGDFDAVAGADDIYLGRGAEGDVPGTDIKVSMMFLEPSFLTSPQVASLWHQIERYGRLYPDDTISYYWDLVDNNDAFATWTSRGSAATPLVLTGTGYGDLSIESWSSSVFGF